MAELPDQGTRDVPYLATVLTVVVVGAFLALLLATGRGGIAALGLGALIFLSAFAGGVILGFIFSVPRIRDPAADPDPATGAADAAAAGAGGADAAGAMRRLLFTNTAMERISEWLATMLVGVGLSQLTNVNTYLVGFHDFLEDHGPQDSFLPVAGPMILILGVVGGFMFMYVYTRLILPRHFYRAEQVALGILDAETVSVIRAAAQTTVTSLPAPGPAAESAQPDVASGQFLRRAQTAQRLEATDAIGVMLDLLYQPDGYRKVIGMGVQLQDSSLARRADFWKYVAAAYGQAHAAAAAGSAEASAYRLDALKAVRRAVELDPGTMPGQLWHLATDKTDNDLATLRDDPEFRRLVGQPLI
jgi:hypothetical protein